MLGRYIYEYLSSVCLLNVIGLDSSQFNVLIDSIPLILDEYHPSVVINAIGLIPQAGKFSDEDYIQVNGTFPILLGQECNTRGIQFIHITTDCVYNGLQGLYSELDPPTETSIYGRSKAIGDTCSGMIIRTSIIGETPNGYSLIEWVKSQNNGVIDGYINHYWNGMTCLQLAKCITEFLEHGVQWNGVRHLYSETITKHSLIELIINEYKLNIALIRTLSTRSNKTLTSMNKNGFIDIPLRIQIREQREFYSLI